MIIFEFEIMTYWEFDRWNNNFNSSYVCDAAYKINMPSIITDEIWDEIYEEIISDLCVTRHDGGEYVHKNDVNIYFGHNTYYDHGWENIYFDPKIYFLDTSYLEAQLLKPECHVEEFRFGCDNLNLKLLCCDFDDKVGIRFVSDDKVNIHPAPEHKIDIIHTKISKSMVHVIGSPIVREYAFEQSKGLNCRYFEAMSLIV